MKKELLSKVYSIFCCSNCEDLVFNNICPFVNNMLWKRLEILVVLMQLQCKLNFSLLTIIGNIFKLAEASFVQWNNTEQASMKKLTVHWYPNCWWPESGLTVGPILQRNI